MKNIGTIWPWWTGKIKGGGGGRVVGTCFGVRGKQTEKCSVFNVIVIWVGSPKLLFHVSSVSPGVGCCGTPALHRSALSTLA